MSQDRFTEVTSASWFNRIGGAIKGLLFGLLLFLLAFPLLFWNEGRAVRRYKTLEEGGGAVVSAVSESVDAAHAGKLIHVTGMADSDATLRDPVFGISADALKLKRVVEMYQWKESAESHTRKKLGGGTETVTTYSYSKVWSDRPILSSDFKNPAEHQNPGAMPYASTQQTADHVTLGAFVLSESLVGMIQNFEPLAVENDSLLPAAVRGKVTLHDAGFYLGADPASPQVGDMRIRYQVALPTEVSVMARQVGNTFEPYGTKAGGTIELLQTGIYSADAMIQMAQESNRMLTWLLRLIGFFVMLAGLNLLLKPLSVLADVLPILGDIVGAGTGLISFLLAAILSLTTIAVAWIVFRPLLGVILIVAAVGLTVAVKRKLKSAKAAV